MLKPLLTIAFLSACTSSHAAPASLAPASPPVAKATDNDGVVELAARRAQMLGWLREYGEAAQFPTDAAGMPASVFLDAKGVRCPMAHLIHKSGRDDLVAAVVEKNNAVRLADVHDGPLHDWMLSSGLTLDEIDLIQGIARIDVGWMKREVIPIETGPAILAKAQVRGKLETAEVALRNGTGTSLAIASKGIPARRTVDAMAHAPIENSAVVPLPTSAELQARATADARARQQAQRQLAQELQGLGGRVRIQGMN